MNWNIVVGAAIGVTATVAAIAGVSVVEKLANKSKKVAVKK